jgi:soluble lytic murein transglycosylase
VSRAPSRRQAARRSGRSGRRRARRRRRAGMLLAVAAVAALAAAVVLPRLPDAVRELALPLRHEDIIRQQAAEKRLDPSLVAAVIYTESRFRDQTSPAGARGLMQITPQTARYIARLSGGTRFEQGDLATPQINIAYGTYYLRYLLNRYDRNEVLALAAYNGGEGNVDRWVASAHSTQHRLTTSAIPFAETRRYVQQVLEVRTRYRAEYARELGL